MKLETALSMIRPLDEEIMTKVWAAWDKKCIPLRSLGRLQEMVVRLAGILETPEPVLGKKAAVVMAADNGVIEEGVTQTDYHVTSTVVCNMTREDATIAIFARMAGADVFPIDIGMKDDVSCDGVICRKIMHGTNNMTKGAAMPREKAVEAIEIGIDTVLALKEAGYGLLATGEMGIGNTTTSSAMASVFFDLPPEQVTGRGAGLSTQGLVRKIAAIKKAISVNKPDRDDPIDVLCKLGGLDIAGLTGCFIGAAACRVPIVIDGFISSVAALCAVRIEPMCSGFMFPSHVSAEPAGDLVLKHLGLEAYLHAGMCLGEGTGAVACFKFFDEALEAYKKLPTFEQGHVEAYKPLT